MGHMDDHAAFVGTYTGCPQRELFLAELVVFLALVVRNVSLPWIFLGRNFNTSIYKFWSKFFLDYIFLVFPALLVMTILSQSLLLVTSVLFACLATLLVFVICEYLMSPDRPSTKVVLNRIIDEQHQPTTFLTYFRSCMLVSVAIAILAVDFPVFPRRFAKTEKYGHSLMDLGVAGFVFASAITNRLKVGNSWEGKTIQKGWNRWIRSSYVILPLIGLVRTTILTILDYPQHVTEYGVHWNFFYTLAVIKVVSNALPKKFPLFWSCLFGTMQQTMLMQGYQSWILDGDNQRDTLFSANAEGICSLMGYLTIYYLSDALACFISKTGIRVKSWIECCWRLYVFALLFYLMQLGAEYALGPPCRRVVNVTYVFAQSSPTCQLMICLLEITTWNDVEDSKRRGDPSLLIYRTMSVLTFALAGFLSVQLFSVVAWAANVPHFCVDDSPWCGVQPCLTTSINKSALAFFLLANILTGLVNLTIDTHHTDDVTSMLILISYMLTLCVVVHFRSYIKLSRKL